MVVSVCGCDVLVDEASLPLVAGRRWLIQSSRCGHSYAYRRESRITILMHRVILAADSGQIVDHINGNGLDNRKANLRICSHTENMRNRRSVSGRVPFKGVYTKEDGRKKKYWAEIRQEGKNRRIGSFYTAEDAAAAYDIVCKELHGEFAVTNKMLGLIA